MFVLDSESIIKAFGVEDPFGILSELVSEQLLLLILVLLAHMAGLVHVGSSSSVKRTIVFVNIVLLAGLCTMESGHICPKIGILAKSSCQSETFRNRHRCSSVSSFNSSHLLES